MSIWNTIKDAIFGTEAKADEAHSPVGGASPSSGSPQGSTTTSYTGGATAEQPKPTAPSSAPATVSTTHPASDVDVGAVLDNAAAKSGQKLDWRHSIVDLMKALGLDSSLHNRQELADELGYGGDKHDSAALNTWLHKKVIEKLKENGGRVPAELN